MGILNIDEHVEEHRLMAIRYPSKAVIPGANVIATQKGSYVIMPSTLTFSGSAGDFTLSGAIFSGFAAAVGHGFWGYFPADSGDAGLAAGWYFCVAGTDTSGTRYKDQPATYGSAYPVTPTAFSTNLSGANAGTTSEITMFATTVPGGSMGPNGRIEVTYQFAGTSASDTKTFRVKLGASAEQVGIYQTTNTTTNVLHRDLRVFNLGSEQRQWSPPGSAATSVSNISYSNIDTSVNQEISFTLQTSAASSAVASLYCSALTVFGG